MFVEFVVGVTLSECFLVSNALGALYKETTKIVLVKRNYSNYEL